MELSKDEEIILTEDEARLLVTESPLPASDVGIILFAADLRLESIRLMLMKPDLPEEYRAALLSRQQELGPVAEELGGLVGQIMSRSVERFLEDPGVDS